VLLALSPTGLWRPLSGRCRARFSEKHVTLFFLPLGFSTQHIAPLAIYISFFSLRHCAQRCGNSLATQRRMRRSYFLPLCDDRCTPVCLPLSFFRRSGVTYAPLEMIGVALSLGEESRNLCFFLFEVGTGAGLAFPLLCGGKHSSEPVMKDLLVLIEGSFPPRCLRDLFFSLFSPSAKQVHTLNRLVMEFPRGIKEQGLLLLCPRITQTSFVPSAACGFSLNPPLFSYPPRSSFLSPPHQLGFSF